VYLTTVEWGATGETARELKALLGSAAHSGNAGEDAEEDWEDRLNQVLASRGRQPNLSFFAFTATPKGKTLELFGRPGANGKPEPIHLYSMRQAIEEGFILDVLQNYTSYKLAFRLAHEGKDYDQREVERSAALNGIMGWVRLHPYNISQKVQVVVEHFRQQVAPLLAGNAKAMVVVGSRQEAVRWQRAMQGYIQDNGYKLGTLVAFSGEVERPAVRARAARRDQRADEPAPARARHPRGLQGWRLRHPAGSQQVPDRLRPAAAVRHVRRQAPGRHPGRADTIAPQPRPSGQGHHVRGRLRQ